MKNSLNISGLVFDSEVDGPGLRTALFLQGCEHGCVGCHNPQTHEFDAGEVYLAPYSRLIKKIEDNSITKNLTLTGGDPVYQWASLVPLIDTLKDKGWHILLYTGFMVKEILDYVPALDYRIRYMSLPANKTIVDAIKLYEHFVASIDLWIPEPFIKSEKSMELPFRGSKNQKVGRFHVYPNNPKMEKIYFEDMTVAFDKLHKK